jgi:hypothetical protein
MKYVVTKYRKVNVGHQTHTMKLIVFCLAVWFSLVENDRIFRGAYTTRCNVPEGSHLRIRRRENV